MTSASGIVMKTVNVAHALSASAVTTARPRPGDGGEMVSEQDPAARRKIVGAVGLEMGRCGALVVEHPQPGRNECAVVTIRNHQDAEDGDDEIQGTHISKEILAGETAR